MQTAKIIIKVQSQDQLGLRSMPEDEETNSQVGWGIEMRGK